ncbi:annexin D3 [Silene latifolia]|uniref:annexin D3 n=1 Tax=Silene latifolia TaxID=37657 RepID=UPI003D774DC5
MMTTRMASLKVPEVVPPPAQDCERLRKAFHGLGTDEEAVIRVLGHRNESQRKKIRETYQQLYNKSLIHDLHSELSGHFLNAISLWTYDPSERDARLINDALKKKGSIFAAKKGVKDWQVIVEIACAFPPQHLLAVRQAYCSLFDCSIEEDISSHISLPLRKLLVSLVSSYRHDKEVVDTIVAKMEAFQLREAIEAKQLDHDYVMWILGTRNFFQLRATFDSYKQHFSSSFDEDILKCGNGDFNTLLNVAILCMNCPEKHFAQVIRKSILGLGTDEDSLSRAIVTRAEVDMAKVKIEYVQLYKTSVEDDVKGDTSGDYESFLLTLLGTKQVWVG